MLKKSLKPIDRMLIARFEKDLRNGKKTLRELKTPLARKLVKDEIKLRRRRLKQWRKNPSGEIPKKVMLKPINRL